MFTGFCAPSPSLVIDKFGRGDLRGKKESSTLCVDADKRIFNYYCNLWGANNGSYCDSLSYLSKGEERERRHCAMCCRHWQILCSLFPFTGISWWERGDSEWGERVNDTEFQVFWKGTLMSHTFQQLRRKKNVSPFLSDNLQLQSARSLNEEQLNDDTLSSNSNLFQFLLQLALSLFSTRQLVSYLSNTQQTDRQWELQQNYY